MPPTSGYLIGHMVLNYIVDKTKVSQRDLIIEGPSPRH